MLPAYREPATLLQQLRLLPSGTGRTLVILVLNRPQSDPDPAANQPLRSVLTALAGQAEAPQIRALNPTTDLYLHDMEANGDTVPTAQGVGLARKTGCDIALQWMVDGAIDGPWIYSTDADATLPGDYFTKLDNSARAVAAVFPFYHQPGHDPDCNQATALYELRLHQYVAGLEYAGSPYAYHSLGSCLAVRAQAYVQVRGFPKRSGGEDFYLLNKLAKLGPVKRLAGECIHLQARYSRRVPFGTGPAVEKISEAGQLSKQQLFYHPQSFLALRATLETAPSLAEQPTRDLHPLLCKQGLDLSLANTTADILIDMGIADALDHCRRQGKSCEQFLRQFHQWFDGFRTLKFIHALREAGWRDQCLSELPTLEPHLWPNSDAGGQDVSGLTAALLNHWHWRHC